MINSLPKNVFIHLEQLGNFPIVLERLSDLWTSIVTPRTKEDELIPWVMPYLKYEIDNETRYLIWFFNTCLTEEASVKEIKEFLEDDKDNA